MTTTGGTGTSEHSSSARRAHPDAELTEQNVEELQRMLLEHRASLEERLERLREARFTGETVPETEEAAALDTTQSTSLDLAESERTLLMLIDRALRKIKDGTYGVSERSGEPIGLDRLRVVPWAILRADEQEQLEHEARQRGR